MSADRRGLTLAGTCPAIAAGVRGARRGFGLLACAAAAIASAPAAVDGLAGVQVRQQQGGAAYVAEGIVEAVRQTVVSAQVPGLVTQLEVKAGDAVKAGQLLLRIDARAANQMSLASAANAEAAQTALAVASKDYQRQQQLYAQEYISQAAMERAEAQYRASLSQANAASAQALASRTQTGFYSLAAPYAGLVADVGVTQGDMAMPGRPLMTVYDPAAMRITATVPQTTAERLAPAARLRIEIPALPESRRWLEAANGRLLPKADATTHTMQIRIDLPAGTRGLPPGTFARVHLPLAGSAEARLWLPAGAVFRRAELTAVYVLDERGRPHLRQVKTGARQGDEIEMLAGVAAGETVAVDPVAASRHR